MRASEEEPNAAGLDVTVRMVKDLQHVKILKTADEENVSAIILGSHGRAIGDSGSVSDEGFRQAKKLLIMAKKG